MDGTFHVVYDEVDTLVQRLITNTQNDMAEARNRYTTIAEEIKRVDGRTNASLLAAIELNHNKTEVLCQTLEKLLIYINTASEQLDENDSEMAADLGVKADG